MEIKQTTQNGDIVTSLSKECSEVAGFEEMFRRFERRMHTQRRSESTKKNYAHHIAMILV